MIAPNILWKGVRDLEGGEGNLNATSIKYSSPTVEKKNK